MAKKVALIGVPMDLGANKPGSSAGPDAIRRAGVVKSLKGLGFDVKDLGDVMVPAGGKAKGSAKMKNAGAIAEVCEALSEKVRGALKDGRIPVTLGGDHSLAMGSVAGVSAHFRKKGGEIGLIWVDAHGDINTPATSNSGNVHGMPLAHLLGSGDKKLAAIGGNFPKVKAEHTCLVGVRDLDDGERTQIRRLGVETLSMKEVDIRGMAAVAAAAVERAGEGTAGIHLSFDIDVVDPSIAAGVGTPSRGGLTYREAHLLMEVIADSGRLVAVDMVEINPLEDNQNSTAILANELIQSALGKRIN